MQNFIKIVRAVFEIGTKNIKNAPTMGVFPPNRALSLLYPYGVLTLCKKLEETNGRSLSYLKTDIHKDTRTRAITKDPFG